MTKTIMFPLAKMVFTGVLVLALTASAGILQKPALITSVVHAQEEIELDIGGEAKDQKLPGSANTDPEAPGGGFSLLIGSLMSLVMTVGAILALLYMIWGCIEWVTAGGESGKLEKARQKISQSVIGLIVLSSVTAIFMFIQQFLGICVLPFFGACSVAADGTVTFTRVSGDYNPGGGGGSGGGSGGGGGSVCTPSSTKYTFEAPNGYCTQGPALVQCHGPDEHPNGSYTYNHYDPCSCVNGVSYQKPGYDFDSC